MFILIPNSSLHVTKGEVGSFTPMSETLTHDVPEFYKPLS